MSLKYLTKQFKKIKVIEILHKHKGDRKKTCEELRISSKTLYNILYMDLSKDTHEILTPKS